MIEEPIVKSQPAAPVRKRYWTRGRILRRLLLLVGLYFGMGAGLAWISIGPKHSHHLRTPAAYHLAFDPISFKSADGTRLVGWFLPAKAGPAKAVVIVCHGVDSNMDQMLELAAMLHRHGFATLLFDFRARGESEGGRCTMGFREVDDLLAAVRFVKGYPAAGGAPISVLGESMGASVALMGAARTPDIRAVVAESPFACMDHALDNHFRKVFGLAGPIVALPVRWTGERMIGRASCEISPAGEIGKIAPRPILLIQDGADQLCPPAETSELMRAAGPSAQLWTVPGADHIMASMKQSEEYERRVCAALEAKDVGAAAH